jgi:acyl carrier protein
MNISQQDFYQKVTKFILAMGHNKDTNIDSLDEEDHLWDLGLMDSFSTVELILFLEDLTQASIELDANTLKHLHTLKNMYYALVVEQHGEKADVHR